VFDIFGVRGEARRVGPGPCEAGGEAYVCIACVTEGIGVEFDKACLSQVFIERCSNTVGYSVTLIVSECERGCAVSQLCLVLPDMIKTDLGKRCYGVTE